MVNFFFSIFFFSTILASIPFFGFTGEVCNYIALSALLTLLLFIGRLKLNRSLKRKHILYILASIGIFSFPLISSLNFSFFAYNGIIQNSFGLFIILFFFIFDGKVFYTIFRCFIAGKIIGVSIVSLLTIFKLNEGYWLYIPNIFFCVSYFLWLSASTHRRNLRSISFFLFVFFSTLAYFYGSRGDIYIIIAVALYIGLYKLLMVRLSVWLIPIIVALGSSFYFLTTFPTLLPNYLVSSRGWTIGQRINLWSTGLAMSEVSLPLGFGSKSYDENFRRYWLPRLELKPFSYDLNNIHSPHNQIILSLVEGGALGLISLVFLFSIILTRSIDKRNQLSQVLLLSFWSALGADWLYGADIVSICLIIGIYYRGTYSQNIEEVTFENSSRYKLASNRRGGKTAHISS